MKKDELLEIKKAAEDLRVKIYFYRNNYVDDIPKEQFWALVNANKSLFDLCETIEL